VHDGQVVASGLLVARSDGAETLEVVEEDLDEIALAVEIAVERKRSLSLGLRVNDRLDLSVADLAPEIVGVVAGVTDERLTACVIKQPHGGDHLVALAWSQRDVDRSRLRVDDSVELGRKTASRAAQSISFDPPFPPDAS